MPNADIDRLTEGADPRIADWRRQRLPAWMSEHGEDGACCIVDWLKSLPHRKLSRLGLMSANQAARGSAAWRKRMRHSVGGY